MRPYTIVVSVVAHVIGASAAVIVPLLADDQLPAPRTATEFVEVVPLPQPPPPPARPIVPTHSVQPLNADSAPLSAPDGIAPEPALPVTTELEHVNGVIAFGNCDCATLSAIPEPPPEPRGPIRVGGKIRPPEKIADLAPTYPAIARMAHVEGIVILEAVIAEDGAVRDVRVLRSIPLLDAAAIDAVQHWRFTPTLLNGEPVSVLMTITVAFKLN